ncbi:hypothetical protein RIF29_18602 [Crotalaria pallida]|uniref:Protein FAM32A-like n=1 Tax=Crotalaria pallida TaxID=3830 RepID=A0AAN9F0G2_CROPI
MIETKGPNPSNNPPSVRAGSAPPSLSLPHAHGPSRRASQRECGMSSSSAYENVVGGKLKLKGKALDVKAGGVKKKKKSKRTTTTTQDQQHHDDDFSAGGSTEQAKDATDHEDINDESKVNEKGKAPHYDDHLTPAERRYIEQREKLDVNRLAKISNKSHRDRIQDFNQYLANMSEHYDIPKVGPG